MTRAMVTALELAAIHSPHVIDRVGAGTFTAMLYARSRFSDAQGAEELIFDVPDNSMRFFGT